MKDKTIIWWGRSDPDYSRNRILRTELKQLGYNIQDFYPSISILGCVQAKLNKLPDAHLVWVPCFRQKDVLAASCWAKSQNIPLVFDPLISAFDKQVFEREKFQVDDIKSDRLLEKERKQFCSADIVVADTFLHANFFQEVLKVSEDKIKVIPVGAEESIFKPCDENEVAPKKFSVLFYGSYIPLQGVDVIVKAALLARNVDIKWTFVGDGPLKKTCVELAGESENIEFLDWMPYEKLPEKICAADVLLGVFGTTPKAGRVIPNKVYQALACNKPVITQKSLAYPQGFSNDGTGFVQIPASDPEKLYESVLSLKASIENEAAAGFETKNLYKKYFSREKIRQELSSLLNTL